MESDLITESIAANLAGVSSKTLQRFAEAGYFELEENSSGERLYSRRALSSVFGLQLSGSAEKVVGIQLGPQKMIRPDVAPEIPGEPAQPAVAARSEEIVSYDDTALPQEEPAQIADAAAPEAPASALDGRLLTQAAQQISQQAAAAPASDAGAERAAARSEAIIEMQEKLLDRLEREVKDLREERDWLRNRIERLEEKADRDQLLLLSEAQTVKRLVNLQVQRKNAMRSALEWFGLLPPTNEMGERIQTQALPGSTANDGPAEK